MVLANKLALVLVLAGALFLGIRDGGKEAVSGHPEALWENGVERVDATISEDTQVMVTDSLNDTVSYAGNIGDGVAGIAD